MEFKEIQKLVENPYIKLGFKDQWEMKNINNVLRYLNNDNAFMSAFELKFDELVNATDMISTIMDIGEVGLFCEEIGEILDAVRKGYALTVAKEYTHEISSVGEECADLAIRLLNFCNRKGIDLEDEIVKKNRFNNERLYLHGKKA